MDSLYEHLAPLTDWIPDAIRKELNVEVWWLVELVVVLFALLFVGLFLKALWRALFRRRRKKVDWDKETREDLESCPLANGPPCLWVYHVPVKLRLIVLAPQGTGAEIDPDEVYKILDCVVPGLGRVIKRDRPRVSLWGGHLSTMGFTNSFHRCTPTGAREQEPSKWIMLAGPARGGGYQVFLGLGLWSETETTLSRKNLEPVQWLDILRLAPVGSGNR